MPEDIYTLNLFQDGQNPVGGGLNSHAFDNIISLENLLQAWKEFILGKKSRTDVQVFQRDLMDNIISLHRDLKNKNYYHGGYKAFNISDPKPRHIHKAIVRDRLLHHTIYRMLYPFFDKIFIQDSYSCRLNKGTHKAMERFKRFSYKVSRNNTRTAWVLKCDIKRFFANIDQEILLNILKDNIKDPDTIWLLERVIKSFHSGVKGKGLPLGNLTSQLLVNIYMNEFDQFVKHSLRVKYYIRYADDFVLLSADKEKLETLLIAIKEFLERRLKLFLHPDKISLKTLNSGIDFLGWVHFPRHRVLRTATKRRMFKNLSINKSHETLASYSGLLKHGNTFKIRQMIKPML